MAAVTSTLVALGGVGLSAAQAIKANKDNGFIDRMLLSYPELEIENYNENEINPDVLECVESILSLFICIDKIF